MSEANDLQRLIENLSFVSDEELIRIINVDGEQYRAEALAVARAEMKRRGYRINGEGRVRLSRRRKKKGESQAQPAQSEQAAATPGGAINVTLALKPTSVNCMRCGSPLSYSGTRKLHQETDMSVLGELGEMYKTGAHQFLDAYTCNNCGHVELFADGIGDAQRPH
jgi:hypothetical protein